MFAPGLRAEVNKVKQAAPGVYFQEGDIGRKGHCNNGWIGFDDYVLVIDGNFPSGPQEVIPNAPWTFTRRVTLRFAPSNSTAAAGQAGSHVS